MPRRCCVQGCKSNYDGQKEKVSTFSFPTDPDRRKLWIQNIPRSRSSAFLSTPSPQFEPSKYSAVCAKHFCNQFVIRKDSRTRPDGTVLSADRTIPKLTDDAFPSIFPTYEPSESSAKRKKPDTRRKEILMGSERKHVLVTDGFILRLDKQSSDGRSYWKCSVEKCPYRCVYDDKIGEIVKVSGQHRHANDTRQLQARKFQLQVKGRLDRSPHLAPREAYDLELVEFGGPGEGGVDDLVRHLPDFASLKSALYNHKKRFSLKAKQAQRTKKTGKGKTSSDGDGTEECKTPEADHQSSATGTTESKGDDKTAQQSTTDVTMCQKKTTSPKNESPLPSTSSPLREKAASGGLSQTAAVPGSPTSGNDDDVSSSTGVHHVVASLEPASTVSLDHKMTVAGPASCSVTFTPTIRGRQALVVNGCVLRISYTRDHVSYWRCPTLRCKFRCSYDSDAGMLICITGRHNHTVAQFSTAVQNFLTRVKERVSREKDKAIKIIYAEELQILRDEQGENDLEVPTFERLKSTLYKLKSSSTTQEVKNDLSADLKESKTDRQIASPEASVPVLPEDFGIETAYTTLLAQLSLWSSHTPNSRIVDGHLLVRRQHETAPEGEASAWVCSKNSCPFWCQVDQASGIVTKQSKGNHAHSAPIKQAVAKAFLAAVKHRAVLDPGISAKAIFDQELCRARAKLTDRTANLCKFIPSFAEVCQVVYEIRTNQTVPTHPLKPTIVKGKKLKRSKHSLQGRYKTAQGIHKTIKTTQTRKKPSKRCNIQISNSIDRGDFLKEADCTGQTLPMLIPSSSNTSMDFTMEPCGNGSREYEAPNPSRYDPQGAGGDILTSVSSLARAATVDNISSSRSNLDKEQIEEAHLSETAVSECDSVIAGYGLLETHPEDTPTPEFGTCSGDMLDSTTSLSIVDPDFGLGGFGILPGNKPGCLLSQPTPRQSRDGPNLLMELEQATSGLLATATRKKDQDPQSPRVFPVTNRSETHQQQGVPAEPDCEEELATEEGSHSLHKCHQEQSHAQQHMGHPDQAEQQQHREKQTKPLTKRRRQKILQVLHQKRKRSLQHKCKTQKSVQQKKSSQRHFYQSLQSHIVSPDQQHLHQLHKPPSEKYQKLRQLLTQPQRHQHHQSHSSFQSQQRTMHPLRDQEHSFLNKHPDSGCLPSPLHVDSLPASPGLQDQQERRDQEKVNESNQQASSDAAPESQVGSLALDSHDHPDRSAPTDQAEKLQDGSSRSQPLTFPSWPVLPVQGPSKTTGPARLSHPQYSFDLDRDKDQLVVNGQALQLRWRREEMSIWRCEKPDCRFKCCLDEEFCCTHILQPHTPPCLASPQMEISMRTVSH